MGDGRGAVPLSPIRVHFRPYRPSGNADEGSLAGNKRESTEIETRSCHSPFPRPEPLGRTTFRFPHFLQGETPCKKSRVCTPAFAHAVSRSARISRLGLSQPPAMQRRPRRNDENRSHRGCEEREDSQRWPSSPPSRTFAILVLKCPLTSFACIALPVSGGSGFKIGRVALPSPATRYQRSELATSAGG